jgi:hypothetical protein
LNSATGPSSQPGNTGESNLRESSFSHECIQEETDNPEDYTPITVICIS